MLGLIGGSICGAVPWIYGGIWDNRLISSIVFGALGGLILGIIWAGRLLVYLRDDAPKVETIAAGIGWGVIGSVPATFIYWGGLALTHWPSAQMLMNTCYFGLLFSVPLCAMVGLVSGVAWANYAAGNNAEKGTTAGQSSQARDLYARVPLSLRVLPCVLGLLFGMGIPILLVDPQRLPEGHSAFEYLLLGGGGGLLAGLLWLFIARYRIRKVPTWVDLIVFGTVCGLPLGALAAAIYLIPLLIRDQAAYPGMLFYVILMYGLPAGTVGASICAILWAMAIRSSGRKEGEEEDDEEVE
jgi:hypothetical protein